MNRLTSHDYSPGISLALWALPSRIADRVRIANFLTGTDPFFAGLTRGPTIAPDGRSFLEWAHCCYPRHTSDRSVTIVLPKPLHPYFVVHEIGHVLDFTLGFTHTAVPVTKYALRSRWEAFAEAFTAWIWPWPEHDDLDALMNDHATLRLFRQLAWPM